MQNRNCTLYDRNRRRKVQDDLKERHSGDDRSRREMQEVQSSVKSFVSGAHAEQDGPVCVIKMHDRVFRHIYEFVAGLSLKERRVEVNPVARDVYAHGKQDPEHVLWIEMAEDGAQTHRSAPIRELIEDCTEFGALVVISEMD